MSNQEDNYFKFDRVDIEVMGIESEGYILDIGGGGEGVIGQLKGRDVIAIDIRKGELEEAVEGPLKIIMDARDMKFLDDTFSTATAFFSMMYIGKREDQRKVMAETWRVLRPGGYFHIWDVDLSERPATDKEYYLVHLRYKVNDKEIGTGYGQKWPDEKRGEEYYIALAEETGFQHLTTERNKNTLYFLFRKG